MHFGAGETSICAFNIENEDSKIVALKAFLLNSDEELIPIAKAFTFRNYDVVVASILLAINVIIPALKYSAAEKQIAEGNYDEAIAIFTDLADYKDSSDKIPATKYQKAEALLTAEQYDDAIAVFEELGLYSDSENRRKEAVYAKASSLFSN